MLSLRPWPKPRGGPHYSLCHFCDTLHFERPPKEGLAARCVRCNAVLYQNRSASLARATALSATSLVLMVIVYAFPFLTLEFNGIITRMNPVDAAYSLYDHGNVLVGLGIGLFTVVTPLFMAGALLYVCGPLMTGYAAPGARTIAKWMHFADPWNMIEVFLLSVLVSLLKLWHMAHLEFGAGFWAFAALMLCMAGALAGIDKSEVWDRLEVANS